MKKHNIVLLPKVKEQMKQDIVELMADKNYEEAIQLLLLLLDNKERSFEIYRDTLVCMIKLEQFDDAIELSEELLHHKQDNHYYDYLDYYIIALYEAKYFVDLMDVVETEKKKGITNEIKVKLDDFSRLALQMLEWEKEESINKLQIALSENNVQEQYYILQKWRHQGLDITDHLYSLLKDKTIHPVIKTIMFKIMQERKVSRDVVVAKFNQTASFIPVKTMEMSALPLYNKALLYIENLEQHNPSLSMLSKELMDHYMFVHYPFDLHHEGVEEFVSSIKLIAEGSLELLEETAQHPMMNEILISIQFYEEIMS